MNNKIFIIILFVILGCSLIFPEILGVLFPDIDSRLLLLYIKGTSFSLITILIAIKVVTNIRRKDKQSK